CWVARSCSFDLGDVDPAHGHHGVHRPLRGGTIRILQRGDQGSWHDLPGKTPAILAPTTLALTAAVLNDRIPITIGFCLIVGHYLEAHRLVRRKRGATIQADKSLAKYGELHGQLVALFTARVIGWGLKCVPDMAVRKGGRVEFRRFARLAVVEP